MNHPRTDARTGGHENGLVHDASSCGEQVDAVGRAVTRVGSWTESQLFDVRVRRGSAVLDLRSPLVARDLDVRLSIERGVVTLLVPDDAVIDEWGLDLRGRSKVKQTFHTPAGGGRTVRLSGRAERGEVRIHSGGIAQLTALRTRDFLTAVRHRRRDRVADILQEPVTDASESRASQ